MSSSLHQKKLEEQRQRQLSRQAQRRDMMANSMSSSMIANSEDVEYMHAYDNPGATIEDTSRKSRKKKSKSKRSKGAEPNISKLIDVSDEDDHFSPLSAQNRKIETALLPQTEAKQSDENNNNQDDDGELTPRNAAVVRQNEDLFCISDASSESGDDAQQRDDISIAGGAGVRPQTAQSQYVRPDTSMAANNFDNLPESTARSASSFINRIAIQRPVQPQCQVDGALSGPNSRRGSLENGQSLQTYEQAQTLEGAKHISSLYSQNPVDESGPSPFTFIPGMEHIKSVKEFVFTPAPFDHKDAAAIRARITRDKKGGKFGGVKYFMHLEMANNNSHRQFILAARKRARAKTSNYLISTDVDNINRESPHIVGKLRSNALGTRFVSYDNGVAPDTTGAMRDARTIRREMCMVMYDTNILGFHGPRRMTLVIPGMDDTQMGEKVRHECVPMCDDDTIAARFDRQHMDNFIQLENKKPIWNQDTQSFVLNFHGRVTMASVKNFQIIHKDNPNYITMQFGRISEDVFTIDYRYPLSAFQAFSIALSSFDSKLACE